MKKIFCFLAVLLLCLSLCVPAFADTELKGSVKYDCTVSEDGKTAKVVVTLSDYYTANSIMMIPEYDDENLTMLYGYWLLRGAITVHWSEESDDAVIAFSKSTDINTQIFEMEFQIDGDPKALDSVGCKVIAKTVENQPAGNVPSAPETTAPRNEHVDIIESTPDETEPPKTEPTVTEPAVTAPPETELPETFLPETEAVVTEAEAVQPETPKIDETEPTVESATDSEPSETEPEGAEVSKPTVNYPQDFMTEDEYNKTRSSGDDWQTAVIISVVAVAVVAAVAVGIILVKKKSK